MVDIYVENCGISTFVTVEEEDLPGTGCQKVVERACGIGGIGPLIFTIISPEGQAVKAVCGAVCGQPGSCRLNTTGKKNRSR